MSNLELVPASELNPVPLPAPRPKEVAVYQERDGKWKWMSNWSGGGWSAKHQSFPKAHAEAVAACEGNPVIVKPREHKVWLKSWWAAQARESELRQKAIRNIESASESLHAVSESLQRLIDFETSVGADA